MIKILNLKLVILLEYQNIKIFLQKGMFQIGLKKFLLLEKLKILFHGHMFLVISKSKNLLECFTKKNCKKTNQKEFRVKDEIKRKTDKLYVIWKGYDRLKRHSINE